MRCSAHFLGKLDHERVVRVLAGVKQQQRTNSEVAFLVLPYYSCCKLYIYCIYTSKVHPLTAKLNHGPNPTA